LQQLRRCAQVNQPAVLGFLLMSTMSMSGSSTAANVFWTIVSRPATVATKFLNSGSMIVSCAGPIEACVGWLRLARKTSLTSGLPSRCT